MFIPSQQVSGTLKAHVVIIGAGPAGMALALALTRRGVDTVLLCSGGLKARSRYSDASRAASLPKGHVDPVALSARRFGGLSWGWGGRCVAPDLQDFVARPDLGLPGWPLGFDDVMRYAQEASSFLGIGTPEFGVDGHAPDRLERWSAEPRLAKCHRNAFARKDGPRVILDVTCNGARIDENGHITKLTARTLGGKELKVKAQQYVIAAGGLETARLLLWFHRMNGIKAPRWTGRGYMGHLKGQILSIRGGPMRLKEFDYQLSGNCYIRRRLRMSDAELKTHELPNIGFCVDTPLLSDAAHGNSGLSLAYLGTQSPFIGHRVTSKAMQAFFKDTAQGSTFDHLQNVARAPVSAAGYCLSLFKQRLAQPVRPGILTPKRNGWYSLTFSSEERPLFENGVALSSERDRFGVPRLAITRRIDLQDVQGAIKANHVLSERLLAKSMEVQMEEREEEQFRNIHILSGDGYHQIGTTRMGRDARNSVVDENCRVHGLYNLYVVGSATFPRSGQANPTFLIICMAERLAKHLSSAS